MKQIVVQPLAVGFCRFHQRINNCTRLRTLGCIGKEPSLPTNDKRADGVFYLVVADFNLTMLKKRTEVRLLILRIGNSILLCMEFVLQIILFLIERTFSTFAMFYCSRNDETMASASPTSHVVVSEQTDMPSIQTNRFFSIFALLGDSSGWFSRV